MQPIGALLNKLEIKSAVTRPIETVPAIDVSSLRILYLLIKLFASIHLKLKKNF